MSIESSIFTLLKNISAIKSGSISRVYPDVTPDDPVFPLIVYQVVGGRAYDYMDRRVPGCEHYRVQISCWSKTAEERRSLALAVRKLIIESTSFKASETMGQAVDDYEDALKLYGSRQDFGIWITP